jgi:Outer membrane protein beta-barrel domain
MNRIPGSVLAVVLFCVLAVYPAASQVGHSGEESGIPIAIGVGGSSFQPDLGAGRMAGITGWIDYNPVFISRFVRGLGIEGEIYNLSFSNSTALSGAHERAFSGGLNYGWRHYSNFRPYGKILYGYGTVDFPSTSDLSNGSSGVTTAGGGLDYRVYSNIWMRADYEYQFWSNLGSTTLHPQGFTIGAVLDLRPFHPRE